jgi:hypothetical protein
MVLQAFIDDSATSNGVFVLAGHIATAETWARFAKDWEQMLPYGTLNKDGNYHFKMSEMASNPERMARVQAFYRIIEDHDLIAISCAIDERHLRNAISRLWSLNKIIDFGHFNDPFFFVFKSLTDHIYVNSNTLPGVGGDRVDLIFDNQSQKKKIISSWDEYMAQRSASPKSRFGATPRFEDDTDFLPLQAADLWAWWIREWHERGKPLQHDHSMLLPPLFSELRKTAIVIEHDEDGIVENLINQIKSTDKNTIIYDSAYRGQNLP